LTFYDAAKALMRDSGLGFGEIDLAAGPDNVEIFRNRLPQVRSIPQTFVDGQHIGGLEGLGMHLADRRAGV